MPLFPEVDQKENFLFDLVALFLRLISVQKAAEIMDMDTEMFITLLDLMGLEFSYVSEDDVSTERSW